MSKGEREITSKLVGERDHIKGEKKSQGPKLQERLPGGENTQGSHILRGRKKSPRGRECSGIPDA